VKNYVALHNRVNPFINQTRPSRVRLVVAQHLHGRGSAANFTPLPRLENIALDDPPSFPHSLILLGLGFLAAIFPPLVQSPPCSSLVFRMTFLISPGS